MAADGEDVLGFAILNYTFFNQGFVPLLVVAIASVALALVELSGAVPQRSSLCRRIGPNLPAQWLFEKCGYVPSGHIENLEVDDDEPVFFKRLRSGT